MVVTLENTLQSSGVDLKAFLNQQEVIRKVASKEIATRIDQVNILITEIHEFAKASGVVADVKHISYALSEVERLHPDWDSSSYYC